MNCILCSNRVVDDTVVCSTDNLVRQWRDALNVDILNELHECDQIIKWKCGNCGLLFYDPLLAGSDKLYEKLQQHDFYYMENKWEHNAALTFVQSGQTVLEVGCGSGVFLKMIQAYSPIDAIGLELNPSAVTKANEQGLKVSAADVHDYAEQHAGAFDVVCHFQVLEHVPNPRQFMEVCSKLLKPGGRLICAVPNGDGFIKFGEEALLNMPPHHISVFSRKVFHYLEQIVGARIVAYKKEPLALYHLDWFCNAQIDRIPKIRYVTWPMIAPLRRWLPILMKVSRCYRLFRGHTVLVVFEKDG